MKILKTITIASIFVAVVAFGASNAFALGAYSKLWEFFPMETAGCNLQDGKTMQDYAEVMKLFNAQLDRLGAKNSEAINFEPYYYDGDHKYSLYYWNYWPNGAEMGDYSRKWTGSWQVDPTPEGLGVIAPYGDIVICPDHQNWSVAMVRKPKTQKATKKSMIVIQEGKFTKKPTTMEQLRKAVNDLVREMDKRKYENGVWIQFPAWANIERDYDFRLITRYDSFVELGVAWEMYAPGTEAHEAIEKIIGDVFSSEVREVGFVTVRRYMPE